jgi:hypothetical protein
LDVTALGCRIHRLDQQPWVKENPRASTQRANFVSIAEKTDGPMNISVNVLLEPPGNHHLSKEHLMARA